MTHAIRTIFATLLVTALFATPAFAEEDEGQGISSTQTNYIGARLLKGGANVQVGDITVGPYEDVEGNQRYSYWQGDTHFAGVKNPETGNKVDIVTEWYWFESSIPRNADFYVGVVKVKSSPNPVDDWYLKEENGWYGNIMWPDDVVQLLEVSMDPSGEYGGVRWDWCVPFDSYKWEPEQTIEVASGYSAGFDAKGGFSEGGMLKELSKGGGPDVDIQAKGYMNAKHSVSTKYTITLHKWQMLVSSGADNMQWQMRILKNGNNDDSAYHEYFVVIQAEKGTPVWIPAITIAANFKHSKWYWFDAYEALSATITDVTFDPPPTCYVDDPVPSDVCMDEGVCAGGAGYCEPEVGAWACNYPEEYETEELTCDGLDNDCDGQVDEVFVKLGMACDSDADEDKLKNGVYVCNDEGTDVVCDENPCANKECGDGCGVCGLGETCIGYQCVADVSEDPQDPDDTESFDCNGITEVGQCDGNWLLYCAGGELVEQYCAFCCGFDAGKGYYDCLVQDKCEPVDECIPSCDGKWCGPDGCGGVCGICDDGETCSAQGTCELSGNDSENYIATCGNCPSGFICGANGQCVQPATPGAALGETDTDTGAQGCAAVPGGRGNAAAAMLLLFGLLALAACRFVIRVK